MLRWGGSSGGVPPPEQTCFQNDPKTALIFFSFIFLLQTWEAAGFLRRFWFWKEKGFRPPPPFKMKCFFQFNEFTECVILPDLGLFCRILIETLWLRSGPRHSEGNVNNNNLKKRSSYGTGSTTLNINNKTTSNWNKTNQTNNKLITNIRSTKSSCDLRLDSWTNNNKPNPTKVSRSLLLAQNSTTTPLNETPPLPTGPRQAPSPSQKSLSKTQSTSKASGFVPKITISYPSVESQGSFWSQKSNNQVSHKDQFLNLTIHNQPLLI